MPRIVVVNPNSNAAMTAMIDRRLDVLRRPGGPELACVTLEEGPPAIETREHARQVIAPLRDFVAGLEAADAIVIGCFSDPGLAELRAATFLPVLGFCEAAVATAVGLGGRYGILTNLDDDIADERAYLAACGLDDRLAGIAAIGVTVGALMERSDVPARMIAAVERLKVQGAESVILGCAGFSGYAVELHRATGMRIVDPTIAATGMAITALSL